MFQPCVFLVAAEILSSSHCVRLPSGVRCSCESQGNPVPSLTWTLAGEAVNHSAHCPIREFQTDHQGIMSVISLPQSDEDLPIVMCLSNNSVGDNHLELHLAFCQVEPGRFFHPSSISQSIHPPIIPSSFNPSTPSLLSIHPSIYIYSFNYLLFIPLSICPPLYPSIPSSSYPSIYQYHSNPTYLSI